jgi:hypothetical protein
MIASVDGATASPASGSPRRGKIATRLDSAPQRISAQVVCNVMMIVGHLFDFESACMLVAFDARAFA